jgi:DNA-binding NtrC family response regulator
MEKIDVVISDKDMPVMSGAAMIRILERLNPNVRVISASGLDGTVSAQLEPGRLTLAKPFTAEQLLRSVDKILHAA